MLVADTSAPPVRRAAPETRGAAASASGAPPSRGAQRLLERLDAHFAADSNAVSALLVTPDGPVGELRPRAVWPPRSVLPAAVVQASVRASRGGGVVTASVDERRAQGATVVAARIETRDRLLGIVSVLVEGPPPEAARAIGRWLALFEALAGDTPLPATPHGAQAARAPQAPLAPTDPDGTHDPRALDGPLVTQGRRDPLGAHDPRDAHDPRGAGGPPGAHALPGGHAPPDPDDARAPHALHPLPARTARPPAVAPDPPVPGAVLAGALADEADDAIDDPAAALRAVACQRALFRAPSLDEGVRALLALLARQHGCARVACGWTAASRREGIVISGAAEDRPPREVRDAYAAAMDEALARGAGVAWPEAAGRDAGLPVAQSRLAGARGVAAVCSVPLGLDGRAPGALTLERDGAPFDAATIDELERVAAFLGPALAASRRAARPLAAWLADLRDALGGARRRTRVPARVGRAPR